MPNSFDFATLLFLYWVVLFMPFMAWVSYRKIKRGQPLAPKLERYRISVSLLIVTGLMGLAAAQSRSIAIPLGHDFWTFFTAITCLAGTISGVIRGRKKAPPEHRERLRKLYAPGTPSELAWSFLAGTCAGIAEEIAYRAVLYELLGRWMGYGFSLIICVLLFVLAHMPQGLRGGIGVGAMAIIFHLVYVLNGSLVAPILVHALYDIALFTILYLDERKLIPAPISQPVEQPAISV